MKSYNKNIVLRGFLLLLIGLYSELCIGVNVPISTLFSGSSVVANHYGDTIRDDHYSTLPTTSGFTNFKVTDYVKVAVNHQWSTLVSNIYHYNVQLQIESWDHNKTHSSVTKTIFVEYDPTSGVTYKDYGTYNFSDAHQILVKLVQVTNANTGATISNPEDNLVVSYGINIERYYDFNYSTTQCPTNTQTDLNGDSENDEITVSWSPITGAEEYELEWTYVDDYTNSTVSSTKSISDIVYDFRYNSTRISTKNLSYKINLIYERGYIIYRVRGVGRKIISGTIVYVNGAWSKPDSHADPSASPCTSSYYHTLGHRQLFNWQYSSTYAEEGKKKEVVGYYDGSLRNRQTVTKVNTTDTAIVGESIYDFQGRKAIDVLPVPAQSPALTYYANFNKNIKSTPVKYSRDDFDKDKSGQPCTIDTAGMSPTSGASRYYSKYNKSTSNQQSYLPDAQYFPFNQVEYTPDNTGRVRRMSGVGPLHQLGTGKETKYYYGRPLQEELDRLFGSEVGYTRHYKKNVVIDPNGQVSISYLDQEGHVIATALSGNTPGNVSSIASQSGALDTLDVDLFARDIDTSSFLNVKNIDGTALVFNTQYLVSTPGLNHTFDYNLIPLTYTDSCLLSNICFNCVYDLELRVRNECGVVIDSIIVRVGSLTVDSLCSGGVVYVPSGHAPAPFAIASMPVGNYQITKTLTVNRDAYDYYLSQYLSAASNTCFKSYETILAEEQDKVEGIACEDDCVSCINSLGTSDNFVLTGKGTYEDWLREYNICLEQCKSPSICEQAYQTMLVDMSPAGQYAEWYDSLDEGGFNPGKFPLSILNYNNKLPNDDASNHAYWKTPKYLRRDGTTSDGYFEPDGIRRSKIPVIPVDDGQYFPLSSSVFTENGIYYTYPENLSNPRDFITYWQESWARSLIKYHPEYCYYKWCILNTIDTATNASQSSEAFDADIQFIETYSGAVSKGWIDGGNNYAMLNMDPYFNHVTDGVAQYNAMKAQIDNFLGSSMSMKAMAAKNIKCPSYYGVLSGINATCTTFVGGTTAQSDEIWKQYKSFYYSAKQQLMKAAADKYADDCGKGFNCCIGSKDFNVFNTRLFKQYNINPFTDNNKFCGYKTYMLYKDKKIRFGIGEEPIKGDEEKGKFNQYYNTGACPLESDFNLWLHGVATSRTLLTDTPLYTMGGFTKLLYQSIVPGADDYTYLSYNWTPQIDPTDSTKLQISFSNDTSEADCKINLQLPHSTPQFSWYMVRDFKSIGVQEHNDYTGQTGFYINAMLDVDHTPVSPDSLVVIKGSTCIQLAGCKFYDQCKESDFATKLFSLMSALGNDSVMANTSPVLLEHNYSKYLNRFIRSSVLAKKTQ